MKRRQWEKEMKSGNWHLAVSRKNLSESVAWKMNGRNWQSLRIEIWTDPPAGGELNDRKELNRKFEIFNHFTNKPINQFTIKPINYFTLNPIP